MSGRIRLEAEAPLPSAAPQEPPQRLEPEPPPPPPPGPEPPPAAASEPAEAHPAPPEPVPDGEESISPYAQKRMDRLKWEAHSARRALEDMQRAWQTQEQQRRAQAMPPGQADPEERALQRFRQEAAERDFNARCNQVFQRGQAEYADFGDAVQRLNQVGYGTRPDVLAAIASMPDGHHVYRQLAQDPDTAARMLSLPPMDMAMELARMAARRDAATNSDTTPTNSDNRQPVAPVTRAPAPLRPVGGNSARSEVPLEKTSMADFIRRRDQQERGSNRIRR